MESVREDVAASYIDRQWKHIDPMPHIAHPMWWYITRSQHHTTFVKLWLGILKSVILSEILTNSFRHINQPNKIYVIHSQFAWLRYAADCRWLPPIYIFLHPIFRFADYLYTNCWNRIDASVCVPYHFNSHTFSPLFVGADAYALHVYLFIYCTI